MRQSKINSVVNSIDFHEEPPHLDLHFFANKRIIFSVIATNNTFTEFDF